MSLNYNLYNEDCIKGISKLQKDSVDFIFCDLPYLCSRISWDQGNGVDLKKLAEQLWRVAKKETPIVFTCNMKFLFRIIEAMGEKYFKFEMIWEKHNATNPFCARIRPMPSHELILFFYKQQPKIYYKNVLKYHKITHTQTTDCKRQRGSIYKGNGTLDMVGGKTSRYNPMLPRSVLKIDKISKCHRSINSTEKPYNLLWFLLKYYTNEGDVVLDPTFGSCSLGAVCKDKNRSFIGYELDEKQYKYGIKRIQKIQEEKERKLMAQEDKDAPAKK